MSYSYHSLRPPVTYNHIISCTAGPVIAVLWLHYTALRPVEAFC